MGFPLGAGRSATGPQAAETGPQGRRDGAAGIRLVFNLLTWSKSFDILILPIKAFN